MNEINYTKDEMKAAIILAFHLGFEKAEKYDCLVHGNKLDWENSMSKNVLDNVINFINSKKNSFEK